MTSRITGSADPGLSFSLSHLCHFIGCLTLKLPAPFFHFRPLPRPAPPGPTVLPTLCPQGQPDTADWCVIEVRLPDLKYIFK